MENSYREFLESSEMSTKEFQLQDVLDIQWGDTNTTKASYVPEGYLAYSASGPDGFLEKFDYDREGIVLSAIGANCGSTFFASGKWSCIKNTIRIFPKSESVDLRYFYYMTKSPDFWPIRGSAQPFISQTDIREMYAEFPEIEAQRRVANLLSRIDRLIKKNQKLSSILEEIAETIFKSWFIDFDPVKAKMTGEALLGMDVETAALFPDSVEETEFGNIPNGWRHGTLGEMALAKKGTSITRASSIEGDIPVVAGGLEPAYFHNKPNVNAPVVTISASGANAGFVRLYGQDIWASDCSFFSRGETPHVFFVYSFLKHHQERIFGMQQGAAQPHIYSSDLARLTGFFPSEVRILDAFERTVAPLFESQETIRRQSSMLSEIRDALLPRLISGELEIPEEMLAA